MELARYGVPPSEVERDPRPSRISALLDAGRVIDARLRLEDTDDTVNAGGVQGAVKETGGPKKAASPIKIELVGFERRQALLNQRAYPEHHTAELEAARYAERQQAMADEFWGTNHVTHATAMRLRVVRDDEGGVSFVGIQGE